MRIHALIVAAGRGTRVGDGLPKQYVALGGAPVLRHTVARFLEHPQIDAVTVVIHPDDTQLYRSAIDGMQIDTPAIGGATRQESVANGLAQITGSDPDLVLIHDAARPFISADTITAVIAALQGADGAIAALAVTDTVKECAGDRISRTLPRENLWRAQTPQGFRFHKIHQAYQQVVGKNLTDDAAVAEAAGLDVRLVPDTAENFKITTLEDLSRAKQILESGSQSAVRTGQGFDVHRFEPGDRVMLCGIEIPHSAALAGHSDADVALHALTDAVLGAIGSGDIGDHFPPSEPRWRGASSALFLAHAAKLAGKAEAVIQNVDLTIICEAPRIGPYREQMRRNVADILALPVDSVSVKATTTEGLGYTGRGEGIAAQAIATVEMRKRNL